MRMKLSLASQFWPAKLRNRQTRPQPASQLIRTSMQAQPSPGRLSARRNLHRWASSRSGLKPRPSGGNHEDQRCWTRWIEFSDAGSNSTSHRDRPARGRARVKRGIPQIFLHRASQVQRGDDGWQPVAGLIRDAEGNLYGTAEFGGAFGYGTVFKLDAAG